MLKEFLKSWYDMIYDIQYNSAPPHVMQDASLWIFFFLSPFTFLSQFSHVFLVPSSWSNLLPGFMDSAQILCVYFGLLGCLSGFWTLLGLCCLWSLPCLLFTLIQSKSVHLHFRLKLYNFYHTCLSPGLSAFGSYLPAFWHIYSSLDMDWYSADSQMDSDL